MVTRRTRVSRQRAIRQSRRRFEMIVQVVMVIGGGITGIILAWWLIWLLLPDHPIFLD
jgi:heterodisulfide reductase subunit A-like polyferredoxin